MIIWTWHSVPEMLPSSQAVWFSKAQVTLAWTKWRNKPKINCIIQAWLKYKNISLGKSTDYQPNKWIKLCGLESIPFGQTSFGSECQVYNASSFDIIQENFVISKILNQNTKITHSKKKIVSWGKCHMRKSHHEENFEVDFFF